MDSAHRGPRDNSIQGQPFPQGQGGSSTIGKEMEGQVITYIGTFGARETHDTRLPTSPLRTWRSRATIFTSGSLKERTPFSEHGCSTTFVHPVSTKCYHVAGSGLGTGQPDSTWD